MTVAETRKLLATLRDAMPVWFTVGDALLEATEIELVSATAVGDDYSVTFDDARDDALRVAVMS